jgi:hypothetical protein
MHVWLDGTRDGFVVLPLLSVVPVMIVVAGDKRKASANRASDQGAEGSSEQTPATRPRAVWSPDAAAPSAAPAPKPIRAPSGESAGGRGGANAEG